MDTRVNLKDVSSVRDIEEFAKLIIVSRKRLRMSQGELAFKAKISQPYLSRIEKAMAGNIPLATAMDLITAMDMDMLIGKMDVITEQS